MDTAHITYTGNLRNEAQHPRSGQIIITDAPVDNKGKGEAFSPTDLLCTALATCITTTMGITALAHNIPLGPMTARVVKHMASGPRRVQRVEVEVEVHVPGLTDRWKELLEHSGRSCPVALSLNETLEQELTFLFR